MVIGSCKVVANLKRNAKKTIKQLIGIFSAHTHTQFIERFFFQHAIGNLCHWFCFWTTEIKGLA